MKTLEATIGCNLDQLTTVLRRHTGVRSVALTDINYHIRNRNLSAVEGILNFFNIGFKYIGDNRCSISIRRSRFIKAVKKQPSKGYNSIW